MLLKAYFLAVVGIMLFAQARDEKVETWAKRIDAAISDLESVGGRDDALRRLAPVLAVTHGKRAALDTIARIHDRELAGHAMTLTVEATATSAGLAKALALCEEEIPENERMPALESLATFVLARVNSDEIDLLASHLPTESSRDALFALAATRQAAAGMDESTLIERIASPELRAEAIVRVDFIKSWLEDNTAEASGIPEQQVEKLKAQSVILLAQHGQTAKAVERLEVLSDEWLEAPFQVAVAVAQRNERVLMEIMRDHLRDRAQSDEPAARIHFTVCLSAFCHLIGDRDEALRAAEEAIHLSKQHPEFSMLLTRLVPVLLQSENPDRVLAIQVVVHESFASILIQHGRSELFEKWYATLDTTQRVRALIGALDGAWRRSMEAL